MWVQVSVAQDGQVDGRTRAAQGSGTRGDLVSSREGERASLDFELLPCRRCVWAASQGEAGAFSPISRNKT